MMVSPNVFSDHKIQTRHRAIFSFLIKSWHVCSTGTCSVQSGKGSGVQRALLMSWKLTELSEENQRGEILSGQEAGRKNWLMNMLQCVPTGRNRQSYLLLTHFQEYYEIGKCFILGLILTSLNEFKEVIMINVY